MTRPLRAALVGSLAALTLSAAPAPAAQPAQPAQPATASSSGTIVFVRAHDVWISRADGSGARALTTDGTFAFPYGSPTQSDAGVVVATYNNTLVRMTQSGRVLNTLDPEPLPTSVGTAIDGRPSYAAISPDGKQIAYTFTQYLTPSGGVSAGFRSATGYTAADRLTDPSPQRATYFWDPSWVGNGRTLQTGGAGSHVQLHDLGSAPRFWFGADTTDFGDTALSRDGSLLAGILGYDATATLVFMAVSGDATSGPPPAEPEALCGVGPLTGISHPTWGPGAALAWEEPDGVWVHPDVRRCGAVDSVLVVPGGSQPHWSPASLGAAQAPAIRNTQRPTITGKALVGQTLRATSGRWSTGGTSYAFRWLRNGKQVAGSDGAHASYRVTRSDRGRRLTVRVTARRSGYTAGTATSVPVQVRR